MNYGARCALILSLRKQLMTIMVLLVIQLTTGKLTAHFAGPNTAAFLEASHRITGVLTR